MGRVRDIELFWTEPPPEPSENCRKWIERINGGWAPNRRVRMMGYYECAEFFGVYLWEYLNVLSPMLYGGPTLAEVRLKVRGMLGLTA